MSQFPHVAILLATYNGDENLQEQLDSIAAQEHANWSLIVSDDNSSDQTRQLVSDFEKQGHTVVLLEGPKEGAAANFMSLARRFIDHVPKGSWLAFCDQDDVWLPDRLSRGVAAILAHDKTTPALYCSRTWITDDDLNGRRLSAARPRPMSFRNALVQNVASGNTILLNTPASKLVAEAASEAGEVVVHDWWAYQIVSGVGGNMVHDDEPTLLYRQHEVNQIGANDNARAKMRRMAMLLSGRFSVWNQINIAALERSAHRFLPENRDLLGKFAKMRKAPRVSSLASLREMGLYRQTRASSAALWVAVLIRRL